MFPVMGSQKGTSYLIRVRKTEGWTNALVFSKDRATGSWTLAMLWGPHWTTSLGQWAESPTGAAPRQRGRETSTAAPNGGTTSTRGEILDPGQGTGGHRHWSTWTTDGRHISMEGGSEGRVGFGVEAKEARERGRCMPIGQGFCVWRGFGVGEPSPSLEKESRQRDDKSRTSHCFIAMTHGTAAELN